jgi:hypothetical protein
VRRKSTAGRRINVVIVLEGQWMYPAPSSLICLNINCRIRRRRQVQQLRVYPHLFTVCIDTAQCCELSLFGLERVPALSSGIKLEEMCQIIMFYPDVKSATFLRMIFMMNVLNASICALPSEMSCFR